MYMENALEISSLKKTYGDFTLDVASLMLPSGNIMGFVGQNGAGKTTTIRLILNMAIRESGEIKVFGMDSRRDELAVKQELAAVFDEIFFVSSWRIREVEKAVQGFYSRWDGKLYGEYLKRFNLPPEKKVGELSRGMKMKLMLAVAMSHGAKLLLLDEPTSGLDPVARDELLDILREYVADGEKSVFFSTHITSDLERSADFITLIDHGRIFYTGSKDGLLEHFSIVKGAKADLTEAIKGKIIGLSVTSAGFTGMIHTSDAGILPKGVETQPPAIDEILVYISKGGVSYE